MADETIRIDRRDDVFIVRPATDEFQGEVANAFLGALTEAVTDVAEPKVVLDFSDVSFVDSLSLGTLVKAAGDLSKQGGKFVVAGAREGVQRTLALTRMDKLVSTVPSVDEAIHLLGK